MQAKLQSFNVKKYFGDDLKFHLSGDFKVRVYQDLGTIFHHVVDVDHEIAVFLSRLPKDIQEDIQELWDRVEKALQDEVDAKFGRV